MKVGIWILFVAVVAQAQPSRRSHVERKLAETLKEIKACGKQFAASYDWAAFDAIDYAAAGKDKNEGYDYEASNMEYLGIGINEKCKDPDFKDMFAKIDRIVYRPTGDKAIRLEAKLDGSTLIFINNVFGGTRDDNDYEDAITNVKVVASTTGPAPLAKVAPPAGKTSAAWDGKYPASPLATLGGLCPLSSRVGNLVVKGGRFTFPWIADDWRGHSIDQTIELGRVMGLVHADGTVATTVEWTSPELASRQPISAKMKHMLDAVTGIDLKFTRHGAGGKIVRGSVDVYRDPGEGLCTLGWEIRDPAEVEAERREAARPRTPAEKAAAAKADKVSQCESRCSTKSSDCVVNHCTRTQNTCHDRCNNDYQCERNCESDETSCRNVCSSEESSCRSDCDQN
ncbi:MAG TPA: hypothetical protein VGG74_20390 [Kofleriaceae bacterium]